MLLILVSSQVGVFLTKWLKMYGYSVQWFVASISVFGGITYWLFGYGLTYGRLYSNPFIAFGYFAVDAGKQKYLQNVITLSSYVAPRLIPDTTPIKMLRILIFCLVLIACDLDRKGLDEMGPIFSTFLFQLSFATTATTIVSGAMAERLDVGFFHNKNVLMCWIYES